MIPEGVFAPGTKVTFVDGTERLMFLDSPIKKLVEEGKNLNPHTRWLWHFFSNSWGQGVINDDCA